MLGRVRTRDVQERLKLYLTAAVERRTRRKNKEDDGRKMKSKKMARSSEKHKKPTRFRSFREEEDVWEADEPRGGGRSELERGRRRIRSMMMMKVRGCGFGIWKGKKEVFGVWKYIRVLGHFTQLSFFPYLFTSPIFNFLSQNKL